MAQRNILDNKKIRVGAWILFILLVVCSCVANLYITKKGTTLHYLEIQTKLNNLPNNAVALKSRWMLNETVDQIGNLPKRTVSIFEHYNAAFYLLENDSIIKWWGGDFNKDITSVIKDANNGVVNFDDCKIVFKHHKEKNRACALVVVLEKDGKSNDAIFTNPTKIANTYDYAFQSTGAKSWEKIAFGQASFLIQPSTITNPPYAILIIGWIGVFGILLLLVRRFIISINRFNAVRLNVIAIVILVAIRAILHFSPFSIFNIESYFNYYDTAFENFAFSPISLFINIVFILLQSFIYYRTLTNIQRRYATVSNIRRKFYFFSSLILRSCILVYVHWAIVANIYNENVNVNLFDIFSTNAPGFILYISCGVYFIARLLQNNILDTPNYKKRYTSDVLYSIPILAIMFWLLRDYLFGTWYIAVIYSICFRAVGFLTTKYKQSTIFLTAALITSIYIASLVVIESIIAREKLARYYIEELAQNHVIKINPNQTLLNQFSYAYINPHSITIADNNQTPLWALIEYINKDTTIYVDKYKNVITPLKDQSLLVSYKYISILNIISLGCYIYFFIITIGILISFILNLRIKRKSGASISIIMQIQFMVIGIVIMIVIGTSIVSINYSIDNTNLSNRKIINSLLQTVQNSIRNYQTSEIDPITWLSGWYGLSGRALMQNLAVYGPDGRIVLGHPDNFHTYLMDDKAIDAIKNNIPYYGEMTNRNGVQYFTLHFPINYNNTFFGYVSISFNAPLFAPNARPIVVELLNMFIIILFVVILISLAVNYWVTQPLRTIQDALRRISLMRKIPLRKNRSYNYEVNELISTYNDMIDTIKRNNIEIAKIERQSAWQDIAKQVAHDIKNPLTPIQLKIQILQRKLEKNSPDLQESLKESLEVILEQMQRINNVVENFKQFAYSTTTQTQEVELSSIISNEVAIYNQYDNVDVTFENRSNSEVYVYADNSQMGRVIGNLCKNAIEATAGIDNCLVRVILEKIEDKAVIRVIDNGTGVAENIIDRIFEPSFTTKAIGSGLGLAICKRIIEEFNGSITFANNPIGGAIFTIELPLI